MYYDNWFNFLEIQDCLETNDIYSCGTLRADRVRGLKLSTEKELEAKGRGTSVCHLDVTSGIRLIQWYDNKRIQIAANFGGIEPQVEVKRWSKNLKCHVDVKRPDAVTLYNGGMGGTDLFDMMASFYKIDHKSKKFYRRIFFWVLGSAVVNGWLHYRRHAKFLEQNLKDQMDLLKFIMSVSSTLCEGRCKKEPLIVQIPSLGRPRRRKLAEDNTDDSEDAEENHDPNPPKKRKVVVVSSALQYDGTNHFPNMVTKEKRRRCLMEMVEYGRSRLSGSALLQIQTIRDKRRLSLMPLPVCLGETLHLCFVEALTRFRCQFAIFELSFRRVNGSGQNPRDN